jgi:AcrR family transcriptional regulator
MMGVNPFTIRGKRENVMARHTPRERLHAVDMQVPATRLLNANFWLQFGVNPEPPMRDKILFTTIDDVSRVGPATFNVKLVCEALEVSYSLINHHFGSRDELLAEATVLEYALYVEELWQNACLAERTPEARLEAWIRAAISWSERMSGWGAVLNYPTASLDVTAFVNEKYRTEMTEWGELNLFRLFVLIRDVRLDRVSDTPLVRGRVPKAQLLNDLLEQQVMASIGWSILGVSVWHAGRHLPKWDIPEVSGDFDNFVEYHVSRLIAEARGSGAS